MYSSLLQAFTHGNPREFSFALLAFHRNLQIFAQWARRLHTIPLGTASKMGTIYKTRLSTSNIQDVRSPDWDLLGWKSADCWIAGIQSRMTVFSPGLVLEQGMRRLRRLSLKTTE
jgi:hypothetical protein